MDKARENIGKLIQNCESTINTQIAQLDELIATHQLRLRFAHSRSRPGSSGARPSRPATADLADEGPAVGSTPCHAVSCAKN